MTLRVGFLGAGLIAGLHAFQIQQCDTPCQFTAVHDPDTERSEALAGWTGARVGASPEDVIDDADVVFICTWTSEHLPMVELVAQAGKAVFLEKPLGVDLESARTIADIIARSRIPNAVGLVLRSSPAFLALRHLVEHPDAGRLMNIVLRDDQYLPIQGVYNSQWRADPARAGSGVLLEHSIHDLDILEWLFGPIASLSARTSFFHGIEGIEDSVSLTARFAAGHTANLTSVWHDVLSRPSQRWMEVFNERSYASLEGDLVGPVSWTRQGENSQEIVEGRVDGSSIMEWLAELDIPVVSAEERFLSAVASGSSEGGPTVADALRAHVLVDAAYRSAAVGGAPIAVTP